MGTVVPAFVPAAQKANDRKINTNSRMTWSVLRVPGQPELNGGILSQNKTTRQANTRRDRYTDQTERKQAMPLWFSAWYYHTGQMLTRSSQSAQSAIVL